MLIIESQIAKQNSPELLRVLSESDLMTMETGTDEAAAAIFRSYGMPDMLIPTDHGGAGRSILDALPLLRLVGARYPSLSIMMTMHHHTVAAILHAGHGLQCRDKLLSNIVNNHSLVASAFAEARRGANILHSTVTCERRDKQYIIAGNKKPCTMALTSDIVVVGVTAKEANNPEFRGVAIIDRPATGLSAETFWPAEILQAAGSHKIVFDNVSIPMENVLINDGHSPHSKSAAQQVMYAELTALSIFQLMISASYLGMASRLAELCVRKQAGTVSERAGILSCLDSAAFALYNLGSELGEGEFSEFTLARCLIARRATCMHIEKAVTAAVKTLGGMTYLSSEETRYLTLATKCIEFHPPARELAETVIDGVYKELMNEV